MGPYERCPAKEAMPDKRERDVAIHTWQQELLWRAGKAAGLYSNERFVVRALRWCLYFAGRRDVMPQHWRAEP